MKTWVSFKYEKLPIFCHYCGILGHGLKHCAAHYAMEKKGERIEYQYGDFLKAVEGRSRASTSKDASQMSFTEEGTECEAKKISVQVEQCGSVGKTATNMVDLGNRSNVDNLESVI